MKRQGPAREYRAASGAGFTDLQAQEFGAFLSEKVGLGSAMHSPDDIVEASKPDAAPTHGYFEWDDSKAGIEWRREQARHLTSHILVVKETATGTELTRAFHSVVNRTARDAPLARGYLSEEVVWRDRDFAAQVLADAYRELRTWRNRYAQYSDLRREVELVDAILAGGEAA